MSLFIIGGLFVVTSSIHMQSTRAARRWKESKAPDRNGARRWVKRYRRKGAKLSHRKIIGNSIRTQLEMAASER
jgi:hypothetical protein